MTDTSARTFELPGFGGGLLHPGDDGYDEARAVFNGMIDRSPGADRPVRRRRRRRRSPSTWPASSTCRSRSTAAATA